MVACNARTLDDLKFARCHLEELRSALLVHATSGKPALGDVVRVGMQLAKGGSLPPTVPARQRKADFPKRCITALAIKCPAAF